MKQHIEDVSPTIKRVELELSASRVDSFLDAAARQYGKNLSLEGYRAGSAPAALVEKRFAKEVAALARQNMLDSVMDSLLREHKFYPVNKAAHDYCPLVRGQACSFNLYIEVIPPFPLPDDLSELIVRVKAPVVDPQEFFAALHKLRQTAEDLRDVTERRRPQDGDVVFLDVRATCSGRLVPGLCAQNLALRLGGKESYPEICRLARTLHVGEEGAVLTPCPENYPDPALLGKEVQLNVRLKSLKTEILPALDDAFAAKLGKKDLRSLQEDVYKELLNKVIVRHQREAEEKLLDGLLAAVDFEPPPSLVSIYRKTYLLQARAYFESQGLQAGELEQKLERLAPEAESSARGQAKAQAFLMAVAYSEKLVLSQEELKQEIEKIARQNQRDAAKLEADLYSSNAVYELQDQLLADKALRHLYTKARKIMIGEDGNDLAVEPRQ